MSSVTEKPVANNENETSALSSKHAANMAAAAKAAEDGKRVYIGNIPFRANQKEIKDLFTGFEVVNVSIPKVRTPSKNGGFFLKRLGYAFAELPSKEEAERAVKELNDKSLDERRLSVKLARTMDKPRTKSESGDEKSSAEAAGKSFTGPRRVQRPRKLFSGINTEDSVFVSGLPAEVNKEEIEELFKELSPSEVIITVKNPKKFRRGREFVTLPMRAQAVLKFADQETQQQAIEQFNGKDFKDGKLLVKVAMVPTEGETEEKDSE